MKSFAILKICVFASLLAPFQEVVSGHSLFPAYGGAPIAYDNHGDDDLGLLLTVLLLAARNRNGPSCNCCNCCNCPSGAKSIPVPYPIPFPTNNPIINNQRSVYSKSDDSSENNGNSGSNNQGMNSSSSNYTISYVPVPVGQNQDSDYNNS